ncbi:UNVERIFIED_ORG: HNH endonuclease [Dietzia maris]|uniref:HNH endonuclease n=1 Tax=Dietzia maris TaxID=37915 RepID=UPI0010EEB32B
MRTSAPKPVKYRSGESDNNALLRFALLNAWGGRCYWCREVRQFHNVEIDHILPKSLKSDELDQLVKTLIDEQAESGSYDIDSPRNLAPICSACNKKKLDAVNSRAALLVTLLSDAEKKTARVVKFVQDYEAGDQVVKAVAAVATGGLSPHASEPVRTAISEFAGFLHSQLETVQFTTEQSFWDPFSSDPPELKLVLDNEGRDVASAIEVLTGRDVDSCVYGLVQAFLSEELHRRLDWHTAEEFPPGSEVGPPDFTGTITIHKLRYSRADGFFLINGSFAIDGNCSVAQSSADGSTLEYVQLNFDGGGNAGIEFTAEDGQIAPGVGEVDFDDLHIY